MKNFLRKANNYWISDASFVTLLVMLLFTVFILPILVVEGSDQSVLPNVMFILLFISGIFSSKHTPLLITAIILVSTHLILKLIRFGDNPYEFYMLERIVVILNTILFVVINLSLLFRDEKVNLYRVIGAVNVYLLLALAGAFGFELIQIITGTSLDGNIEIHGKDKDFASYMYYSLASISTVGYGDIYAVSISAKMLSSFLSMIGILYPAVVISKLVSYSVKNN